MLKIRLRRMGAKRRPFYRVIVAEHSMKRDGRFLETLGHYDPLTDPATFKINAERVQHWLSVGAKPSETVEHLLKKEGIVPAEKFYNKPKAEKKSKAPVEAQQDDETSASSEPAEPAFENQTPDVAADSAERATVVEAAPIDAEEAPEKPVEATDSDPAEGAADTEDDK